MHGIILKTLRDFVVETYDQDAWETVQRRADVEEKTYVPVTVYPDADLYELVDAAAEVADTDRRAILEGYGAFVIPSLLSVYEAHIDDDWSGLELVANIQRFHTSLRTRDLADLTTPRVRTNWTDEGHVRLVYDSDRQLCDVARGAIQGVADHFGEDLRYEEHSCMLEGDDDCQFTVRRASNPAGAD